MNKSKIITFAILTAFVLSMPFSTINANAIPPNSYSSTYETPGIIMKFCQNAATTLQECDEKYSGYTHTDRIYVLVYANGFNEDSDKIDSIGYGQSGYGKITVTTRDATADEIAFTETGPDTGVFLGVVKMTGENMFKVHDENGVAIKTMGMKMDNIMKMTMMGVDKYTFMMSAHDVAVKIPTGTQDGAVTVSWEVNEDITIVKSATWEWRVGEISFDKEQFIKDEPITFKLHDKDLWIHHADFHTYYIHAYSDSDLAGIYVPVSFTPNHDHGGQLGGGEIEDVQLSEPASSSLIKYTPDGEYKLYFWWQPGGVIGVDKDYNINIMVHDGLTDIMQSKLTYGMEIYLNGELIEKRTERFADDGHAVEPVRFDQRGTAKIVITDIFDGDVKQDFSFQVAPEAIVKQVVGKHSAFTEGNIPEDWKGRMQGHYVDVLEGSFDVTFDDNSFDKNTLRVSNGDSIYIEYEDRTLPDDNEGLLGGPYSSADQIDIIAQTFVFDHITGYVDNINE
jgi:hypothetical protein